MCPKLCLSSTIAGARSLASNYLSSSFPSPGAAPQPPSGPRSYRDSFQYLAYTVSTTPPLLRLPNRRICKICTKRGPETPHDRVCHLSAIHACVVVAFMILVLLGEEPTVFVALRHYRLRGGLGPDGVRGGHYCVCRTSRKVNQDSCCINEPGTRAEDSRCAFE